MMLLKVFVQRLAARAFKESMKMHVGAILFGKSWTVNFAQTAHTRSTAFVTNFSASITPTMI
jgi:hypothetical protein